MDDADSSSPGTFSSRVQESLELFQSDYRRDMAAGLPRRLSISDFLRRHGISKAYLYRSHNHLVSEITAALRHLQAEQADQAKGKKETLTSLKAEVISLKKRLKFERSDLTSRHVMQITRQMGPMFESRQVMMREMQALEKKVRFLEEKLRRYEELNSNLVTLFGQV